MYRILRFWTQSKFNPSRVGHILPCLVYIQFISPHNGHHWNTKGRRYTIEQLAPLLQLTISSGLRMPNWTLFTLRRGITVSRDVMAKCRPNVRKRKGRVWAQGPRLAVGCQELTIFCYQLFPVTLWVLRSLVRRFLGGSAAWDYFLSSQYFSGPPPATCCWPIDVQRAAYILSTKLLTS